MLPCRDKCGALLCKVQPPQVVALVPSEARPDIRLEDAPAVRQRLVRRLHQQGAHLFLVDVGVLSGVAKRWTKDKSRMGSCSGMAEQLTKDNKDNENWMVRASCKRQGAYMTNYKATKADSPLGVLSCNLRPQARINISEQHCKFGLYACIIAVHSHGQDGDLDRDRLADPDAEQANG